MKRNWTASESEASWSLDAIELEWLGRKAESTILGFALSLKFFQLEGRFPEGRGDIPVMVVEYVAEQLGVPPSAWTDYDWVGRTAERQRSEIRERLGFREATVEDGEVLVKWLAAAVVPNGRDAKRLAAAAMHECRVRKIEPPAAGRVERMVAAALHDHDERFCATTFDRLPAETTKRLDELVAPAGTNEDGEEYAVLLELRGDPGKAFSDGGPRSAVTGWARR